MVVFQCSWAIVAWHMLRAWPLHNDGAQHEAGDLIRNLCGTLLSDSSIKARTRYRLLHGTEDKALRKIRSRKGGLS